MIPSLVLEMPSFFAMPLLPFFGKRMKSGVAPLALKNSFCGQVTP